MSLKTLCSAIFLLILASPGKVQGQDALLEPGRVEVQVEGPDRFRVRAGLAGRPGGRSPGVLTHGAFAAPGVEISELTARSTRGPAALEVSRGRRMTGFSRPGGAQDGFEISYRVRSLSGRLPLFAPLTADQGGSPVRIGLSLEPGLKLGPQSFPRFEQRDGRWQASLDNHPSAIVILVLDDSQPASIFSVQLLTDAGIVLIAGLIAVCALIVRRRRSRPESGGKGQP